jgi:Cft2 family RNA processing exonuclease
MLKIYALGGSGENGRNCYAVETAESAYLFDCGVKREVYADHVGEYPLVSRELVSKLKAVFLSHVHEDHSAALPLLYHLGYTGKIYASRESISSVQKFIQKWQAFVQQKGGELPYSSADVRSMRFAPLEFGSNKIEDWEITCGRSGHVLGSLWLQMNCSGHTVFYSGDIVRDPLLLKQDRPGKADIAILNCAYAGKHIQQTEQIATLKKDILDTICQKGKALLPLPPKGRASDITILLTQAFPNVPIYADEEIITNMKQLAVQKKWVRDFALPSEVSNLHVVTTDTRRVEVCEEAGGAIILTQDGMLTSPKGLVYYNCLKQNPINEIIITGHTAKGTEGDLLFDESYCQQQNIRARKNKIIFKVHFNDDDLVEFNKTLQARHIILFHADAEKNADLIRTLAAQGVDARTLAPGTCCEF